MKSQKYFCGDCHELFEVHSKTRKGKPYCTGCGDSISVKKFEEPKEEKETKWNEWKREEIDKMLEMHEKGLKLHTISIMMNRSHSSVRCKFWRVKKGEY